MNETRCYAKLDEIAQHVIRGMTANGTGIVAAWLKGVRSGGTCSVDLGLREVVRLATPLYVRNEIYHPTNGALRETAAYHYDKRIVLSKMNVLVAENDLETVGERRQRREEAGTKSKIPDEDHGSSLGISETKL